MLVLDALLRDRP